MSGYCAMGSVTIATAPIRTIRMAMTIATMGRPTKKRDISAIPRRRGGRRRRGLRRAVGCRLPGSRGSGFGGNGAYRAPGPEACQIRDDDLVTRGHALGDDPHRTDLLGGLDRAEIELPV